MNSANISKHANGKASSISDALRILNAAADESSDEIKELVHKDFHKFKKILEDVKPDLKRAFDELKDATTDSVSRAKEKVVETTKQAAHTVDETVHHSPWYFIGGVAALSAITGFMLGRTKQ